MRITLDKNGHPFGFCEAECGQQLRVGGDKRRVKAFVARYPWAAGEAVQDAPAEPAKPVTVTVAETAPAPEPVQVKPVAKRSPLQDAAAYLLSGGVSA